MHFDLSIFLVSMGGNCCISPCDGQPSELSRVAPVAYRHKVQGFDIDTNYAILLSTNLN